MCILIEVYISGRPWPTAITFDQPQMTSHSCHRSYPVKSFNEMLLDFIKCMAHEIDFIKCMAHEIELNDEIIIIIIIIIIINDDIQENKNTKIQNRGLFVQKKEHIYCLNM